MNLTASSSAVVIPLRTGDQPARDRSAFSNLDVALAYARANMRVFPCAHTKLPLIAGNWLSNATTDEKQIRAWWTAHPDALVGLPLKPLDALVLDADRHEADQDGVAHLRALCAEHEPLPPHPIVLTANGGEHHIFRQSSSKIGNRKLGNGLETRGIRKIMTAAISSRRARGSPMAGSGEDRGPFPSSNHIWRERFRRHRHGCSINCASKKTSGSRMAAAIVINDMRKLRCAIVPLNWPHKASQDATIY